MRKYSRRANVISIPWRLGIANSTLECEAQILDKVLEGALHGGVVVVPPLKEIVEEQLGKPVALSTIYRMLARNDWRKLTPDTANPQGCLGP